jgi:hypothetical protein
MPFCCHPAGEAQGRTDAFSGSSVAQPVSNNPAETAANINSHLVVR